MPKRTRKHKKRVRRKTRRKGRRRRRRRPRVSRRRRRRRQRGGSEDYDALRKEMFQAVRLHKETGEFPSPVLDNLLCLIQLNALTRTTATVICWNNKEKHVGCGV